MSRKNQLVVVMGLFGLLAMEEKLRVVIAMSFLDQSNVIKYFYNKCLNV